MPVKASITFEGPLEDAKLFFSGDKWKDRPITPEEVNPSDKILYPCLHDPFTTYIIPPEDKEIIKEALMFVATDSPALDNKLWGDIKRILKYLS
jgi:hypothetical protein